MFFSFFYDYTFSASVTTIFIGDREERAWSKSNGLWKVTGHFVFLTFLVGPRASGRSSLHNISASEHGGYTQLTLCPARNNTRAFRWNVHRILFVETCLLVTSWYKMLFSHLAVYFIDCYYNIFKLPPFLPILMVSYSFTFICFYNIRFPSKRSIVLFINQPHLAVIHLFTWMISFLIKLIGSTMPPTNLIIKA